MSSKEKMAAKLGISILLGWLIVVYLSISFTAWNMNPEHWDGPARFIFGSFGIAAGSLVGFLFYWENQKG